MLWRHILIISSLYDFSWTVTELYCLISIKYSYDMSQFEYYLSYFEIKRWSRHQPCCHTKDCQLQSLGISCLLHRSSPWHLAFRHIISESYKPGWKCGHEASINNPYSESVGCRSDGLCNLGIDSSNCLSPVWCQWPLLLTWFNFNPSMDK